MNFSMLLKPFICFLFIMIVGCSNLTRPTDPKDMTISIHDDSTYVETFDELGLGKLLDFHLKLPDADKRWVELWVEAYRDGDEEPQRLITLSYGLNPEPFAEGNIGFGMIEIVHETPLLFLYSPTGKVQSKSLGLTSPPTKPSAWDYAIGNEEVVLALGETQLLGVYRESKDNMIRMYPLQDETGLKQMIQDHSLVLLLKIKVEDGDENIPPKASTSVDTYFQL